VEKREYTVQITVQESRGGRRLASGKKFTKLIVVNAVEKDRPSDVVKAAASRLKPEMPWEGPQARKL
jgi:hypothetical protein